jgi:hypothetical protein
VCNGWVQIAGTQKKLFPQRLNCSEARPKLLRDQNKLVSVDHVFCGDSTVDGQVGGETSSRLPSLNIPFRLPIPTTHNSSPPNIQPLLTLDDLGHRLGHTRLHRKNARRCKGAGALLIARLDGFCALVDRFASPRESHTMISAGVRGRGSDCEGKG